MTAQEIVAVLADKHAEDVFVPECKDGPTQLMGHLRLDAWAMRKSWSNPTTYGYEVKVSRADFLRDDKWHAYLNLCSQFFFVCPHGLISAAELPPEAGLLWVSQTGSRLFVKKKAQHRGDVQIPETLFRYVLMCRASIRREYNDNERHTGAWWKRWLEQGAQDIETGKIIGRKLRELVSKKVDEKTCENERLKKEIENVAETVAILKRLGFDPKTGYVSEWSISDRLKKLQEVFPGHLKVSLVELERAIMQVNKNIQQEEKRLAQEQYEPHLSR